MRLVREKKICLARGKGSLKKLAMKTPVAKKPHDKSTCHEEYRELKKRWSAASSNL
jgi:hypothetical protein